MKAYIAVPFVEDDGLQPKVIGMKYMGIPYQALSTIPLRMKRNISNYLGTYPTSSKHNDNDQENH